MIVYPFSMLRYIKSVNMLCPVFLPDLFMLISKAYEQFILKLSL